MSRAKNSQRVPAAVAGVAAKPYTGRSERDLEGMTAAGAEAVRALDRRMTEGLNLVHGQLAAERQERQVGFRQAHEARNAIRKEMHEGFQQAREERETGFARLEKLMTDGFREIGERFARMEAAILKLTERISVLEERTAGIRRLVWGVFGGLALLIAGGVLRPLFDRAVAALFAGG